MAHEPTKEELYAQVDEWFRTQHPEAPERLHATSPEHAELRRDWLFLRDQLVNQEVNRIYWDTYPGAPEKIDPSNPAHREFQQGWLEIRDRLLERSPQPDFGDEGGEGPDPNEPDLSYLRAGLVRSALSLKNDLPRDLHAAVDEYVESGVMDVFHAHEQGLIKPDGWWKGPETFHESHEPDTDVIGATLNLHGYIEDGHLTAVIDFEITRHSD